MSSPPTHHTSMSSPPTHHTITAHAASGASDASGAERAPMIAVLMCEAGGPDRQQLSALPGHLQALRSACQLGRRAGDRLFCVVQDDQEGAVTQALQAAGSGVDLLVMPTPLHPAAAGILVALHARSHGSDPLLVFWPQANAGHTGAMTPQALAHATLAAQAGALVRLGESASALLAQASRLIAATGFHAETLAHSCANALHAGHTLGAQAHQKGERGPLVIYPDALELAGCPVSELEAAVWQFHAHVTTIELAPPPSVQAHPSPLTGATQILSSHPLP
jgi:hypothetical protein